MKKTLITTMILSIICQTTTFAGNICNFNNNNSQYNLAKSIETDNKWLNNIINKECTTNFTYCTTQEQTTEITTINTTYEQTSETTTISMIQKPTVEITTEITTMQQPIYTTTETTTQQSTYTTTEASTETTTQSENTSSFANQVLNLVNIERSKNGLEILILNNSVSNVAQIKAEDMYNNNYFSHNSPTYGTPFEMLKSFNISYNYAGENIARGQSTAEKVVSDWMNSEGHRKNILNSNYKQMGLGYKNGYWVQMFIG